MKKVGLIVFGIALVAGVVLANIFSFGRTSEPALHMSVDFSGTKGSGNVVSETRDLADFNGIDVGGVFKVDVTAQKDFAVTIEADDNLLPLITTEVDDDGILRIESEGHITPGSTILVHVYAPEIRSIDVSGAAAVDVADLSNESLSVESSGVSKVNLKGETSDLTVDVSGASKVNAEALATQDATIDASGSSGATVNVSGDLKADASGASKIYYAGTPANVERSTSGAGKVIQK